MAERIKIVTHGGHFHTDDIFAVATLVSVLGENNVEIVRSRDKEVIETGDYVVDVGGVYDEAKNLFDHHQEGGAGKRSNGIPYAAFGLVWKKYGEKLCGSVEVAEAIERKLVQPIDAIDNAVQFMETKIEGVFLYEIGEFFEAFWPSWKEDEKKADEIFLEMMRVAGKLINREIIKRKDKLEAQFFIKKQYENSEDKRLIVFDRYYPARKLLAQFPEPLFAVFPKGDGDWMLTTVSDDENSFKDRKSLPLEWAGKRDEELEAVTQVPGALFCHLTLWLAGAKTKEAILKMAQIALNS